MRHANSIAYKFYQLPTVLQMQIVAFMHPQTARQIRGLRYFNYLPRQVQRALRIRSISAYQVAYDRSRAGMYGPVRYMRGNRQYTRNRRTFN